MGLDERAVVDSMKLWRLRESGKAAGHKSFRWLHCWWIPQIEQEEMANPRTHAKKLLEMEGVPKKVPRKASRKVKTQPIVRLDNGLVSMERTPDHLVEMWVYVYLLY